MLTVTLTPPEYGRECVDTYKVTAAVDGMTLPPLEQSVTDPMKEIYVFVFSEVDLCRDNVTSVTTIAVTDGREGTLSPPVAIDDHVRSSKLKHTMCL